MPITETLGVAREIIRALDELSIPYVLGGSLASSLHGIPRSTQDVDLAVVLVANQVAPLVRLLRDRFYIDEERALEAIAHRSSFNVIHLPTMTKVDLFISQNDRLGHLQMARRQSIIVGPDTTGPLWVSSAEDTILQKLAWFKLGGEVSERQWLDVLGVLKVREKDLDLPSLLAEAEEAGLGELLQEALRQISNRS